jgi:hypothetical protein
LLLDTVLELALRIGKGLFSPGGISEASRGALVALLHIGIGD